MARHFRVSKSSVLSLGLWARGKGEAVAVKVNKGKYGIKWIEIMMSRRSLKKMTNRVVFLQSASPDGLFKDFCLYNVIKVPKPASMNN